MFAQFLEESRSPDELSFFLMARSVLDRLLSCSVLSTVFHGGVCVAEHVSSLPRLDTSTHDLSSRPVKSPGLPLPLPSSPYPPPPQQPAPLAPYMTLSSPLLTVTHVPLRDGLP